MPAADITIRRNGNFVDQGEGPSAAGFRYTVTPGRFSAGTTEGRSIIIENQTNNAVAVSFPVPISNDIAKPIAAGQQLTVPLNGAFEDDYSYTVTVNEGGTIFRAHGNSNPKIVYP